MLRNQFTIVSAALAVLAGSTPALAQHDGHKAPAQPKQLEHQPGHTDKPADAAKVPERIGDPYPFDTCPISGEKLGSMGEPFVKMYEGREIRFCCDGCPPRFEKDLAASMAKLDEKVGKDQTPLYPVKTSIVTGKDLPAKPYDFVYGNRLIRLGAEAEKAEFLKDPKRYIAELDKAVVAEQGKHYPLTKCPVSGEAYGGDMGEPVDMVYAGRLIRVCCKVCKKDIEKDPAKFIAMADAARKGEHPSHNGDHKPHDHK
jgi:YHS domain-containing protein